MKKVYFAIITMIAAVLTLAACSGDPPVRSSSGSTYRVDAMLLRQLLPDTAAIYVMLQKNGSDFFEADIHLSGKALDTGQGGYLRYFAAEEIPVDSVYRLHIVDGDSLDINLSIVLPDSFLIQSPDLRQFTGQAELIDWTAVPSADGYILATVPPDTDIVYAPFGAYVTETDETIPPGTFLDDQARIVGTHMIYVAAYTGAPVEFFEMPFQLPESGAPEDNVSSPSVEGRLCGLLVAPPDSMLVYETQQ